MPETKLQDICTQVLSFMFRTNELWCVRACVMTVTFELAIDGFGNKRPGSVNVCNKGAQSLELVCCYKCVYFKLYCFD
jgi:hypothetical protein